MQGFKHLAFEEIYKVKRNEVEEKHQNMSNNSQFAGKNVKHKKLPPVCESLSNSRHFQRRLLVSQFWSCWSTFGKYLSKEYYFTRLIESGEELVGFPGFHDVAEMCFQSFYDSEFANQCFQTRWKDDEETIVSENEQTNFLSSSTPREITPPEIGHPFNSYLAQNYRALFAMSLCKYLKLLNVDPFLTNESIVNKMFQIMDDIKLYADECILNPALFWAAYNATFHIKVVLNSIIEA
ncbi:hypothetical protein HK096_008680, partial [Nowakowskiella sp. JEL0078]